MESKLPEDVKSCTRYFRYLHEQWHDISMKFPVHVTTALVDALAVQVELELEDMDQDIGEMAGLCGELLNSNILIQSLTQPISGFARAISIQFKDPLESKILSEKVIDCLRKATVRSPGFHEVPIVLARSLYIRFVAAPSDDDHEEGMIIWDRILMLHGSGDQPSPYRQVALSRAGALANARFNAWGKPKHLEHAIYHIRTLLDGTSIEDPDHVEIVKSLSHLERLWLGRANAHDALFISPESAKVPSFHDLIAPSPEAMAIKPTSTESLGEHLDALGYYNNQLLDVANIEDGIKYCRHLVISYPRSELASAAWQPYANSYTVLSDAPIKSSTSMRQFQPIGMVSIPLIHFTPVLPYLPCLFPYCQHISDCYVTKKTCVKSCNSSPLWLTIATQAYMTGSLFHLAGRQLHAVLDNPLPRPLMTMPCCRCGSLSHLLRHLTNSIPGSSQRVVVCT